jgi:DNA-binding SARP family transcriptional activator
MGIPYPRGTLVPTGALPTVQRRSMSGSPRNASRDLIAGFFGGFGVTLAGQRVDTWSSRRTRTVLAYLVAHHRRPIRRDELLEVFWPGTEPSVARNRLHVALNGVRQVLRAASPEPVIERHVDTYHFTDSVEVHTDIEEFESKYAAARRADRKGETDIALRHYEAAGQLYEGDFLPDDPYIEWTTGPREAFRLQAIEALERLMEMYIVQRQYGPATVVGRRILGMDACNERVHQHLMRCYAESDQRHLALVQYQRLTTVLWGTFRVRPSHESTELYRQLSQSPVTGGFAASAKPAAAYHQNVTNVHVVTGTTSPAGILFECEVPGCGRRVGIDRTSGKLVVIDKGDPYALHRGFVGGVEITTAVFGQ